MNCHFPELGITLPDTLPYGILQDAHNAEKQHSMLVHGVMYLSLLASFYETAGIWRAFVGLV